MTKNEALKMAIEALEDANSMIASEWSRYGEYDEAIDACKEALDTEQGEVVVTKNERGQIVMVSRQDDEGKILSIIAEALEQPAQEPVAWMNDIAFSMDKELLGTRSRIVPLYAHPAQREWVGLSDDEIDIIMDGDICQSYYEMLGYARVIEHALKEKNT